MKNLFTVVASAVAAAALGAGALWWLSSHRDAPVVSEAYIQKCIDSVQRLSALRAGHPIDPYRDSEPVLVFEVQQCRIKIDRYEQNTR
ncbi:MAG: hypothetical protein ACOYB4_07780 [Methyloceanibacter sp.]